MIGKIVSNIRWLPHYIQRERKRHSHGGFVYPRHVYFCICDHFEPYWNRADNVTARKRISRWLTEYPTIAERFNDVNGNIPKYSFFYPEEEYRVEDIEELARLCRAGYGEIEIHLHHDNDTTENLKVTLNGFKHRLHEIHGVLPINKDTGEISYGFIHGNWSLNNSRPDGRWCGVDNEIPVLLETGCYADFTLPSAPNPTQTRKVNSIYYANDILGKRKAHDWGVDAKVGVNGNGLLMVQGPLSLNWKTRKFGLIPKIENGGLFPSSPPTLERIESWIRTGVCVEGAPDHVFVKIYTHGTQDNVMKMLFDDNGLNTLFTGMIDICKKNNINLHFMSARQIVNKILMLIMQETNSKTYSGDKYVLCDSYRENAYVTH